MTVHFISRMRGESTTHIRESVQSEASLCGSRPKPINPDKTVLDCWIVTRSTDNPAAHAKCQRCIDAAKKGKRK